MRVLQVWNSDVLDLKHLDCMMSVNTLCIHHNLEHSIVCKNKDLFVNFGNKILIDYKDYIQDRDINWWKPLLPYHQSQADFVRLEFAKIIPDLFYIDADVELYDIPEFVDNGKPYLGIWGNSIDFFIMYVNGNTQFFVDLLEKVKRFAPPIRWLIFMDFFSLRYRVGGNNIKTVNIISEKCYKRNWF